MISYTAISNTYFQTKHMQYILQSNRYIGYGRVIKISVDLPLLLMITRLFP